MISPILDRIYFAEDAGREGRALSPCSYNLSSVWVLLSAPRHTTYSDLGSAQLRVDAKLGGEGDEQLKNKRGNSLYLLAGDSEQSDSIHHLLSRCPLFARCVFLWPLW